MDTVSDGDLADIRKTIQGIKEAQQLETKGNYKNDQARRQKYMQYKNDTSTYDSTVVDNVLDTIPQNRNGRRTVKQWLQAADEIGKQIANLSNEEIEEIAYKSWFDIQPSKSITQYDRQAKQQVGFQKFTSDEWINTINNAVNEARNNNEVQQTVQQETQELPVVDQKNAITTKIPDSLVESAKQQGFKYKDMNLEQVQKALENKGIKSRFDATEFSNENEGAKWRLTRNEDGTVTREIILNPNASEKTVVQEMAIHELTHDIIAKNTDTSTKLYKEVKQWLEKDTDYQEQLGNLKEIYGEDLAEEEAIAKTLQTKFGNQEEINRLVNYNPSMARKIYDWVVDKLNKITGGKIEKLYWEDVRNKFERAYSEEGNHTLNNVLKFSINQNFINEYDNWNKTDRNGYFILGKTSNALKSIGLNDYDIVMDKSKILDVLNKHSEMNDSIIKQIPDILENPTLILKSQTVNGRIVVFSEVMANNGKPVLVAMELNPSENTNNIEKIYKVASAYGRQNVAKMQDWLNNQDNILYIDKQKNRTKNWLSGLGLQLPVPNNLSSSNNSITSSDKNVNTTTKYSMQNSENNTRNIQGLENYDIEDLKAGFKGDIQQILEDNDIYDVDIIDLDLHGSRLRGTANNNSDLDVVVQYEGDIREDDLFDILNEKPLEIEGIKVDINPIQENIKDYMERSNKYDQEILLKNNTQDSEGRTLSKQQQEYFKDSKIRTKDGRLLEVYHGSMEDFNTFYPGTFFTDDYMNADGYASGENVFSVYLNIKNPLVIDCKGAKWDNLNTKYGSSTREVVSNLDESKYDGVIFENINDSWIDDEEVGSTGNVYYATKSDQIKNVDNTNPTSNPDIRYSISTDGKMQDSNGKNITLEAESNNDNKTLLAIHNLSEEKLRGILELGGFPVPSIAITNPDINSHDQFGDISVIFNKNTINPANRANEVYDRDVWSPVIPEIHYDINGSNIKEYITNNLELNLKDSIISDARLRYLYPENLADMVNRYGEKRTLEILKDSKELQYLYHKSENPNYKPQMKNKNFSNYHTNETLQRFIDIFNNNHDMSLSDFFYHYINYKDMELSESERIELNNEIKEAIKPEIQEYYDRYNDSKDNKVPQESINKAIQEELDNEIDSYGKFYDFLMNASHLEKNGVYEVIDETKTLDNITNDINKENYDKWVNDTFGKLFKETHKGIRNDKELFTPSGNRRSFNQLYDEYNLENLVKKLTKGKTKAGQKTFFEGGFGKTSANLATQFNSIEDIKNNQNKLKTSEEIQPIIQELTDKFNNDLHELVDYRKNNSNSYSNEFAVAMETFEDIQAAVEEFASNGKLTPDNFRKVLDSYYVFDTEKIPNNVINTIIDDLNEMRNIPTDYFEAKPQRAVGFDEIDAIVIPSDISNDVKQQLKDLGIKTIEYDRNNENERANIVKSLNEYKFSKSQLNFDQYLESRIAKKGTRTTLGELRSTYNAAPTADNILATSKYTKRQALNPTEIANTNKESMNTTPQLETKNYKKGNKQSSFVSNILNDAQFLNKDLRQEMSKDENIRYYSGITNAETLEKAYNSLTEGGEKETLNWFSKDEKNTTAEDVAKGWILLKQYQDSGDYQGAVEVAKKMRQMGTSAGQAVQAYNIMARMSPEGMFYYAQSELNEAYNKMVEGKSKQWIEKNQDKFTLTPEETQTIIDTMKEVSEMEDGREKSVKLAQIQQLVSDKIPPTAGQGIKAWMRISMLFNPKTQVRNVMGNTVVLPVNATADVFSGAIDKLISKKTGVRTTGVTTEGIKGYAKGFKKGLFESYDDFRKGINTRNVEGNRFEIGEGKSFTDKGLGKALNRIDNILSFSLDVGDRGFYEASFTNSINNQLVLNKTNQVTQEMIDIATNEALQRTWQDNNAYTEAVLSIRRNLNKLNVKGYGLGDVLIPFAKTPANLTKAIVDYSPVGLTKTLTLDAKKFNNSLHNGQYSAQLQHQFVQNLGKGMAGSLLYALGYGLAKAGFATGESDDDKDVKNFMKNSLGIGSYSIKIGNKSFTYDWAQPVATPLAIMTNYVKYSKDNPDAKAIEKAIKSLDIGSEQLLKQSFMESINTVLNGSGTTMENLSQAILDLPARAIPTLSKQVADMVDSTQRTSFEYGKPVQSAINSVVSKIPFASKSLPASVDTLGNEIQKYGGNNSLFNVMINPANTNKGQLSKAGEEIYNVYMETGDTTIFPRTAPYYINSKGEKINMTAQERSKFQTVTGKYVEDSLSTLIKDSEYKKLSNEEKAKVINQIVSDSYSKAKYDVLKIDSNEYEKLRNTLKEIKPSTYYNYKFKTEGMKKDSEKIDVLINANYTNKEKTKIYETYIGSSDEKYQIMKNTDINITEYLKYKSQNFAADKEDDGTLQGKSISGSKKEKVLNYIQNMNITYTQKLMLFGMEYTLSDSEQKYIANYVSSLNISKEEKLNMLGKFKGFTVYKDGSYKY